MGLLSCEKNRFFLLLSTVSLLGCLLLLVLVGLVAGGAGQRALQDLEDLLVFNLLVGFEQRKVRGTGGGQTLDTVLGDGCGWLVPVRTQGIWIQDVPRVVNKRETGALSESPAGSYCLNTPLRTHSTTPTLAAFSSSSWRKLKGN